MHNLYGVAANKEILIISTFQIYAFRRFTKVRGFEIE
jgi:hypothetical protein